MSTIKNIIVFILLSFQFPSFGQERDSTDIKKYLELNDYPYIDTVYYFQEIKNKRVKKEGWKVIESIGPKSHFIQNNDTTYTATGEYYLGVWKYYSNSGLIAIDTNFYEDGYMLSKQYKFRSNGKYKYIFVKKIYYQKPNAENISEGKIRQYDFHNKETKTYYNRKGVLKRKIIWENDEILLEKRFKSSALHNS
ncbi:hypothetical protein K6119_11325 [Paracrocinitomix mangrovi]|uniref:hypothetical protein n=1 Tax=Paracrocinitomix mangrovi TaxID=2862509 RepID=UPI001C8EF6A2|nr:hypothetical protein [Paracrocinitomix mangrovi]UKN00325.1 hypothetical protein K6119_11325 [Paracrocinitomix mangrovi]